MIHRIWTLELSLHLIDPTDCLDRCSLWDGLLPSDEVFLESMMQFDLLMNIESIVVTSILELLIESDISSDRSSIVGLSHQATSQ